jgi:hypothetical protein
MSVKRYRKRPIVIEAIQYTHANAPEVLGWMGMGNTLAQTWEDEAISIPTPEGVMRASPGDWIIRDIQGEFYPCKPDIFEATYELADEQ